MNKFSINVNAGFSLIEILLVLSLSTIIFSIFGRVLNITMMNSPTRSFQKIFNDIDESRNSTSTTYFVDRGLQMFLQNNLISYPDDSLGKRHCQLDGLGNPNNYHNLIIPTALQSIIKDHGVITGIRNLGNYMFLSANSATSSDPDFYIFNASKETDPQLISNLNTGPGVANLVISGHFVFLANTSVNNQFQVIDISSLPTEPLGPQTVLLFSQLKIPGSKSTSSKLNPVITSISSDNYGNIYLGSQKSDLGEIFIATFNGREFVYNKTFKTGGIVNDLFANSRGLWATSPSQELFHFATSGSVDFVYDAPGLSGNGNRIDLIGKNFIILGRTVGNDELIQINGPLEKIGNTIEDVIINVDSTGKIFVIILDSLPDFQSEIQIWDTVITESESEKIILNRKVATIALPYRSNRISCGQNTIFVATATTSLPMIILPQ